MIKINKIYAKTILSKSRIYEYTINPYAGCGHACTYCYAAFMKRFTGHKEKWGAFVDVKINAPELLAKEILKKPMGRVWLSGVCDPYQPVEMKYGITGQCLRILAEHAWPVTIQTKSPLVLRDMDVLTQFDDAEVGFSIGTGDESMRKLLEPHVPPIAERIKALDVLHSKGIRTFAMIAPILPGAEGLVDGLRGKVDYVLVDRLNYHYASRIYRENKLTWALEEPFFLQMGDLLKRGFEKEGLPVEVLF